MKSHLKTPLVLTSLILLIQMSYAQHSDTNKKYHAVFQLSTSDTLVHKSFIKQLNNLINAMDRVEIEVVTHGPGVEFLFKNSAHRNNIEKLRQRGVTFLVCQNTLNEKKIQSSEFLPLAKIIPAGIAHVIIRQSEGWSYIKVGF